MVSSRFSFRGSGLEPQPGSHHSTGHLGHGLGPLLLQLLFITLFVGVLVTFLYRVPKNPSDQKQEKIYQELNQLRSGVDRLCRPCPWDWTSFQGNCYFFSKSTRNWTDSLIACQEMGAQLVIIENLEEQKFLKFNLPKKHRAWIGISDLEKEDNWQWVNGSALSHSFSTYWNEGEPNNQEDEDCAEFKKRGWNDEKCAFKNFWICKKPALSFCSHK
ncbi:CD209 antigen-like protein 2 isoform X1 [Dipodomys merriami]|uniref:CD209 antigen-like protein 2 isoform X1 n=1 Tax=Dipodomys merriami TaxID=94247 RepID=UPI003855E470